MAEHTQRIGNSASNKEKATESKR